MRVAAVLLLLLLSSSGIITDTTPARAESSNACKQCADQQQACKKNYSAKTCKTEFDICMKGCKQK